MKYQSDGKEIEIKSPNIFLKSSKELMVLPKGFLSASYVAQGLRITEDLCYSHT